VAFGGVMCLLAWKALAPRHSQTAPRSASSDTDQIRQQTPTTAFEPTDWPLAPVAWTYIGVLVLLVVCPFVIMAAYPSSLADVDRSLRIAPPGPRLQTNAESDLKRFRDQEAKRLNGTYWIDRQKGTVHVPIDEAMKKLVDTGIPGFPKGQP
jgi:hypothetical protein